MFFFWLISGGRLFYEREDGENRGDVAKAARGALHADKTRNFGVADL